MDSKISNDRLDNAVKEQIRTNLVDGWVSAAAPRARAQELADLTVHAVDEALRAMDRVTQTAASPEEEFSTFLAAIQVMQGVLAGMVEQILVVADSLDWNKIQHNFEVGSEH